jgi:hypothetical protein
MPKDPDPVLNTSIDPRTMSTDLPLLGTTTNFVKYGHPFERGGQGQQIAGVLYIPHILAKDVVAVRVTLVKKK